MALLSSSMRLGLAVSTRSTKRLVLLLPLLSAACWPPARLSRSTYLISAPRARSAVGFSPDRNSAKRTARASAGRLRSDVSCSSDSRRCAARRSKSSAGTTCTQAAAARVKWREG